MANLLTTIEAAGQLGCTPDHIRLLIRRGDLTATKRGRDWFLASREIEKYQKNKRPVGRPKKGT